MRFYYRWYTVNYSMAQPLVWGRGSVGVVYLLAAVEGISSLSWTSEWCCCQ